MKKCCSFLLPLALLLTPVPRCMAQETLYGYFQSSLLTQNDPSSAEWTWDELQKILSDIMARNIIVSEETCAKLEDRASRNQWKIEKDAALRLLLEGESGLHYTWTIENKHRFDELLVAYGMMPYPIAVLPKENVATLDEAEAAARSYLQNAYHVTEDNLFSYQVYVSYELRTMATDSGKEQAPYWSFTFVAPGEQEVYFLTLTAQGAVYERDSASERAARKDPLQTYLAQMEEEKGAFHFWSLKDKVDFAKELREMVEDRLAEGYTIFPMVQTIIDTKFRLPSDKDISEEEAVAVAVQTVGQAQGFPDGWETDYDIGRSLLDDAQGQSVWRITFWIKDPATPVPYGRGRVQLDAHTGEVISCDTDGTTLETSIPYEEMI